MKKKKHARWRWYEILLVGALLGLAVCSTAWLTSYWGQMRAAQQTFEKLAQAVRAAAPQPEEERGEVWQKGVETLQAQNRDCLAWLYSADTGLDYPVMYTPQQPEYYLRRDFEEQKETLKAKLKELMTKIFRQSAITVSVTAEKSGMDGLEEREINNATTYINPRDYTYIFAENNIDNTDFWVQIGMRIKARRVMSAKQIPMM